MNAGLSRRLLLIGAGGLAAGAQASTLSDKFAALERRSGGRLGVALYDSGTKRRFAWRGDERFAMCSTFKLLLAAAVLQRVDRGTERLDRGIAFTAADLVNYSPVVAPLLGGVSPSVETLCIAAVTRSDNTAANLLLPSVGGPPGLTRFVRSLGDRVTRLDRNEPTLNQVRPGDLRDTTSPRAMLHSLDRLLLGNVLSAPSRERLLGWLIANQTGDARLRAGVPAGWRLGDKTGTSRDTTADVGIVWPPGRAPLLIAAYLTGSSLDDAGRNGVIADAARLLVA